MRCAGPGPALAQSPGRWRDPATLNDAPLPCGIPRLAPRWDLWPSDALCDTLHLGSLDAEPLRDLARDLIERGKAPAPPAALMSLVQSATLNGHDPYRYLKDILDRLPTQPARQIADLLPQRWKPQAILA